MHMTLFSLATAMMSLFVPKIYEKFAFKEVLTISVIVAVASTAAMALGKNALTFYILGAVRGMSTSLFPSYLLQSLLMVGLKRNMDLQQVLLLVLVV